MNNEEQTIWYVGSYDSDCNYSSMLVLACSVEDAKTKYVDYMEESEDLWGMFDWNIRSLGVAHELQSRYMEVL